MRGLVCLWLVGGLMLCGPVSAHAAERVRGQSFWPVPVAATHADLVPFGDGQRAWVVGEGGLFVVDLQGARMHERTPWRPTGELIQTQRPGRAWVISAVQTQSSTGARVQLVEAGPGGLEGRTVLEADRVLHVREQPSGSPFDVQPQFILDKDLEPHAYLWVVFTRAGSDFLAVLDEEGQTRSVTALEELGLLAGNMDLEAWQVIPVGKGAGAWLKTDRQLFFIDAEAGPPVRGGLLTAEEDLWVVPIGSGRRAWVMARVRSQEPSGTTARRLFAVDLEAPARARTSLLLDGGAIRQVVVQEDGLRAWVAGSLNPDVGGEGGLFLLDFQGRSLLSDGPLLKGQKVFLARATAGSVWALTYSGDAYLLDERGRILARGSKVLPEVAPESAEVFGTFPTGSDGLLLRGSGVIHLRAEEGAIRATPLLEGEEISSLDVDSVSEGVWLQSSRDGFLYFISLAREGYLDKHFVLANANVSHVLPSAERGHGWIIGASASFAYVPLEQVGAVLALKSGALVVEHGRDVRLRGRLEVRDPLQESEAGGLDLHWPGREHAAEVGGALEVLIQDPARPGAPVASALRRHGSGAPRPRLNWHLEELTLGEHSYRVVFKYQDAVGTRAELVVDDVRFQVSLGQQRWFRTAVACLLATLLFILPMVAPPRTRFVRSWLPLATWCLQVVAGSGLALANVAQQVKVHFPTLVGVLLVEMLLCLALGAFSPPVFYLLSSSKPFQWLVPLALELPAMRRRLFADYVVHVRRKLEAWRRQANDERFVSLPVDFREGRTLSAAVPAPLQGTPEERLCHFLTHSDARRRGNVLIESAGGRGKSALLREVVRLMLLGFEEKPSRPLPVLCNARFGTLEEAILRPLEPYPVPPELHELLLLGGHYIVVVDGLTESTLGPEALQEFIEGRFGDIVRLLLTSRPHPGFRQAVESSERWLVAEPRRLDEEALERFVQVYAPEGTDALSQDTREACRGPDGTYLTILARLALLLGKGAGASIAALYEQAFRHLLRRGDARMNEDDEELLIWAGELCLRTYWEQGLRSLRYRNAPEQERMRKLLQAGVLVPDDPNVQPVQEPVQVRFFHDSMQSFLTARGLFAREHASPTWDILWRAAGDPFFTLAHSELVSGAGSELFQMCLQVFGPEEKLRRELRRQLLEWASLYDDDLKKRDIQGAMSKELWERFQARLPSASSLSPGGMLRVASELCAEDLRSLGHFYMRMASLLWPLRQPERGREGHEGA